MSVFFIFEFIDVDVIRLGRRIVRIIVLIVNEYILDVPIIIVHFGLFFAHLHPFAASWSIVVMEYSVYTDFPIIVKRLLGEIKLDLGTYFVVFNGIGVSYK